MPTQPGDDQSDDHIALHVSQELPPGKLNINSKLMATAIKKKSHRNTIEVMTPIGVSI